MSNIEIVSRESRTSGGGAVLGAVLGAVIGGLIDRRFAGTIRPLAIGFVISSAAAFTAWRVASSRSSPVQLAGATSG